MNSQLGTIDSWKVRRMFIETTKCVVHLYSRQLTIILPPLVYEVYDKVISLKLNIIYLKIEGVYAKISSRQGLKALRQGLIGFF